MEKNRTIQEIVQRLETFSPTKQKQVLNFTRQLSDELPEGTPIQEFLKFAGTIPLEDLEEMKQAIEEDCDQVYASKC